MINKSDYRTVENVCNFIVVKNYLFDSNKYIEIIDKMFKELLEDEK